MSRSWSGPWSSYSSLEWSREEDQAREGRGRINTTTGNVGTDKYMDKGGSVQYLKEDLAETVTLTPWCSRTLNSHFYGSSKTVYFPLSSSFTVAYLNGHQY